MPNSTIFSLEIVLNELSFEPVLENKYQAQEKMITLLETYRQFVLIDPEEIGPLRVTENFMQIPLVNAYTIQSWYYDQNSQNDLKTFFLTISTPLPFLDPSEIDGYYNHKRAQGLTFAALHNIPGISISFHEDWNSHILQVEITTLEEVEKDYKTMEVSVYHACYDHHIRENVGEIRNRIEQIKRERNDIVTSGSELWNRRFELFPHLVFSDDVFRELRRLRSNDQKLPQIIKRLFSLERYCSTWESGPFDYSQLPGEPRQESDSTLQQFGNQRMFVYPDGQRRQFTWHLSIAIREEWRLYFEPLPVERRSNNQSTRMIIGYIGPHLHIASEN